MGTITLVTGQAGTGKTTWLMNKVKTLAPGHVADEYGQVLAITRMHGARRRLETKLRESCPDIRVSVRTIDAFALSILNRWRTALGYDLPISAASGDADFLPSLFGVEAGFRQILREATGLLDRQTVARLLAKTYPLIVIDEFQDCHGDLLNFVKALSRSSSMLLAADDFQLLDTNVNGCPALAWVRERAANGEADLHELALCHRTTNNGILAAARHLRENTASTQRTIPVICCQAHGPAAWKIIHALFLAPAACRWKGTTAIICPTRDAFLGDVLSSCTSQLQKKNLHPVNWRGESNAEEQKQNLLDALQLSASSHDSDDDWVAPQDLANPVCRSVCDRIMRLTRLRGLTSIPTSLVARQADKVLHEHRAYLPPATTRVVTTVHGAKNREFDNVFVLWPYSIPADTELQRRWLYNAITRSRSNCMLLVRGDENRARNDAVLGLLGPPEPAFPAKKKSVARTTRRAKA